MGEQAGEGRGTNLTCMVEHAMFMALSQDLPPHLARRLLNLVMLTLMLQKGVSLSLLLRAVLVSSTEARSLAVLTFSLLVLTEPRPGSVVWRKEEKKFHNIYN